jgi:hypothetical protein
MARGDYCQCQSYGNNTGTHKVESAYVRLIPVRFAVVLNLSGAALFVLLHLPPVGRDRPVRLRPGRLLSIPQGDVPRHTRHQNAKPFRLRVSENTTATADCALTSRRMAARLRRARNSDKKETRPNAHSSPMRM